MTKTLPSKLYKYQSYNVQTLDNLKNRRLWFSKPSRFNDPFDCAIYFEASPLTAKDWKALFQMDKREISKNDVEKFDVKYITKGRINKKFKDDALEGMKKAFQDRVDIMRNDRGVACFSEVVDNMLMWSHYADGHRGFCLEYDTNHEPFANAFPVTYSYGVTNKAL